MAAIHGDWYASRSTHDGEAYLQSDGTVRFVYSTQPDGAEYIVAKVWAGDDQDYESTAKLVAAAPELLAACQAVANDCNRILNGDDFSGMSDADLFRAFLDTLDPVIAKARGRIDADSED